MDGQEIGEREKTCSRKEADENKEWLEEEKRKLELACMRLGF